MSGGCLISLGFHRRVRLNSFQQSRITFCTASLRTRQQAGGKCFVLLPLSRRSTGTPFALAEAQEQASPTPTRNHGLGGGTYEKNLSAIFGAAMLLLFFDCCVRQSGPNDDRHKSPDGAESRWDLHYS